MTTITLEKYREIFKFPVKDKAARLIQQFQGCILNKESLVSSKSSLENRAALVSSVSVVINSAPNKPNALFIMFIFVVAIIPFID